MDSITQAVLGAAVGEAALGKKVGAKAAAWGAVMGTVPDLDVFAEPFVSEMHALLIHRGFTHALIFAPLAAIPVGLGLERLHRTAGVGWKGWAWMVFWALFTHPLLDAFTNYGTQNFWPFSRYPVAFSTISIVDPLYTVPLLIGLVTALCVRRDRRARRIANRTGLALSCLYLLFTVGNKLYVDHTFKASLQHQDIAYDRLFTSPTLFNNLLWSGLADDGETVWVGLYSIMDDDRHIEFRPLPKRAYLLNGLRSGPPVETLLWFTQGYFTMEKRDGGLLLNDLHVGRTDMWLNEEGAYIFSFRLQFAADSTGRVVGFTQDNPVMSNRFGDDFFSRFWQRIQGQEVP